MKRKHCGSSLKVSEVDALCGGKQGMGGYLLIVSFF